MHTHTHTTAHTRSLSSPRGLLGACGSNCRPSHHWSLGAGIQLLAGLTLDCSDDSDADSDERNRVVAAASRRTLFFSKIFFCSFYYPEEEKKIKKSITANVEDLPVEKEFGLFKETK